MSKTSIKLFIVLVCLLSIALARRPPTCQTRRGSPERQKKPGDLFSVLALSWLPQFCSSGKCFKNSNQNWDEKSLTIHGYWPGGRQFTDCWGSRTNYPCFDDIWNSFTKQQQNALWIRLRMLWPITTSTPLWNHEWNKHGSCYAYYNLGYRTYDDSMFEDVKKIFKTYFMSTMKKYNDLTVNTNVDTTTSFANKAALASSLGLSKVQDSFFALCNSDNFITEIRFCYDLGNEGSQQLTRCPSNPDKQECQDSTDDSGNWRFAPVSGNGEL